MAEQLGGLIALSPVGQLHLLFVGSGWAKLPGCWPVHAVCLSSFCHRAGCPWLNGPPLSGRVCNSGLLGRLDAQVVHSSGEELSFGSSLILTDIESGKNQ